MTQLALLGEYDLDNIIEFILSCDEVGGKYKDKLINGVFIRECVMFEDLGYYLTYHFNFSDSHTMLNLTFDKGSYCSWEIMKERRIKLEKICLRLGIGLK